MVITDAKLVRGGRNNVVARVCWLLEREFNLEPGFPKHGRDRFATGNWHWSTETQQQILPKEKHWMIGGNGNLKLPVSAEWGSIFQIVGKLTEFKVHFLENARSSAVKAGLMTHYATKRVQEFTQPATMEALRAGCTSCVICGDTFAETAIQGTEPAVEMVCGHFIGERCLQAWVDGFAANNDEDNVTCPHCRTCLVLGQFPGHLRGHLRPAVQEFVAFLRNDRVLDEQVDKSLLDAKDAKEDDIKGCYGPEIGGCCTSLVIDSRKRGVCLRQYS
ncbi:hypothetical protein CC86DRAFT_382036 [Ophiobolus disseminans]|uniref:RING-type domain-containing protein n=1 Tax=Ophiobolus disseminans TaxID=1469910 RepID=A0A6A7A360_9PLEO|nr:hypothetical protein CC86DRAFT_382036 [Ophiobolus disseminans]